MYVPAGGDAVCTYEKNLLLLVIWLSYNLDDSILFCFCFFFFWGGVGKELIIYRKYYMIFIQSVTYSQKISLAASWLCGETGQKINTYITTYITMRARQGKAQSFLQGSEMPPSLKEPSSESSSLLGGV